MLKFESIKIGWLGNLFGAVFLIYLSFLGQTIPVYAQENGENNLWLNSFLEQENFFLTPTPFESKEICLLPEAMVLGEALVAPAQVIEDDALPETELENTTPPAANPAAKLVSPENQSETKTIAKPKASDKKVGAPSIGKPSRILAEYKVVNGRKVCAKKNDRPAKSKKNPPGQIDGECCLDPDEIPNSLCYYPPAKYGNLIQKYLDSQNKK